MENKEDEKKEVKQSSQDYTWCWDEASKALFEHSRKGEVESIRELLGRGADINVRNWVGDTALSMACSYGQVDVAELLLKSGADIKARDNSSFTALHSACYGGHTAVVKTLLQHGVDFTATGKGNITALMLACVEGHDAVVEVLLEHEADFRIIDDDNKTALHWACANGHVAVVKLLLRHCSGAIATDNAAFRPEENTCPGDEDAADVATGSQSTDPNSVTRNSEPAGSIPDASVSGSKTPLHCAVSKKDNLEIVKLLIEHGANINAEDSSQKSVLYTSIESTGDIEVVDLLLQKGADINTVKNPLFPAINGKHSGIVEKLVENGANVNAFDDAFCIPLHCVVENHLSNRGDASW